MRLAAFIAGRYLFAKKSHNVINIISAISAIGMAVGTAALIIILSIYNGFDSLIRSMMGTVEPDLLITPTSGKVFVPQGDTYDWIYDQPEVTGMCCILEENARPLRGELGSKVGKQLRIVPEIIFYLDSSLDYVEHIEELLKK